MKKYYIEVINKEDNELFLQSVWFHSLEEAMEFARGIEFVDSYTAQVDLMSADWDEETDEYGDIEKVKTLI